MATAARTTRTRKKGRNLFLKALAESGNVGLSCTSASVGRSTVYGWRAKDQAFAGEWDTALEAAGDVLEAECRRRAVEGVEEPIMHQGRQVGTVRKYSDLLLIFLMKSADRRRFDPAGYVQLAAHETATAELLEAFQWAKDFRAAEQAVGSRPAQIADQLSEVRLKGGSLNLQGGNS